MSEIVAERPGPRAWALLTLNEARMVWRDPAGIIIPVGLPLILLVMHGLGAEREGVAELGGLPPLDAIVVPLTLCMVVILVGVVSLPSFLAHYRRAGVLRRLAVTPAHPAMLLTAQVVVSVAQAVAGVALAAAVARLAFDVAAPQALGWAALAFALTLAAAYACGALVAAVAPTTNAAIAIGLVAFLAMLALGGGFGDPANLPDWLATTGEALPFGAGVQALSAAWAGRAPEGWHLAALGAATVLAAAAAAKLFRWE